MFALLVGDASRVTPGHHQEGLSGPEELRGGQVPAGTTAPNGPALQPLTAHFFQHEVFTCAGEQVEGMLVDKNSGHDEAIVFYWPQ